MKMTDGNLKVIKNTKIRKAFGGEVNRNFNSTAANIDVNEYVEKRKRILENVVFKNESSLSSKIDGMLVTTKFSHL